MERFRDIVSWETVSGPPLRVGDVTLTPQSQALIVRWPNGGFVWNRPAAILVERAGQTERMPIVDVTRLTQWTLLAAGLGFAAAALIVRAIRFSASRR